MRILIADDHELFREGLKVVLNALGDDVTLLECGGLDAAVEIAAGRDGLDLAILDFDMPGMNRATGVAEFCARFPKTPVVVLAGMFQREDVVASLLRGASGFVPKALGKDAMVSAFRLVLAGEKYLPSVLLFYGDAAALDVVGEGGAELQKNPLRALTEREHEVLAKLLDGLPNKGIGRDLSIKEVTVKLHLRNIFRKLGAKNRAQAVKLALDWGWAPYDWLMAYPVSTRVNNVRNDDATYVEPISPDTA